ncbi:MAG TPA: cytochrome c5 family protein [Gammaproteobacteria bacterium]|nr:cytochrome c5 family protein [Gammaproteobacteria bacterium]
MQAKILENIRPVGEVNIGSVPADSGATKAVAAAGPRSGEQVYNGACIACHASGVAGAPKLGDKTAWAPRAAKGIDGLLKTATSGLNAMPPKGTCADCSDEELKSTIEYMLKKAGL